MAGNGSRQYRVARVGGDARPTSRGVQTHTLLHPRGHVYATGLPSVGPHRCSTSGCRRRRRHGRGIVSETNVGFGGGSGKRKNSSPPFPEAQVSPPPRFQRRPRRTNHARNGGRLSINTHGTRSGVARVRRLAAVYISMSEQASFAVHCAARERIRLPAARRATAAARRYLVVVVVVGRAHDGNAA